MVIIEATADKTRQIHWASGGTSGMNEQVRNVMLVAAPKIGVVPVLCITLAPLQCPASLHFRPYLEERKAVP